MTKETDSIENRITNLGSIRIIEAEYSSCVMAVLPKKIRYGVRSLVVRNILEVHSDLLFTSIKSQNSAKHRKFWEIRHAVYIGRDNCIIALIILDSSQNWFPVVGVNEDSNS
uniref:Transposase_23 domain-containing protein n=1 Tax=Heterorhabditis bacteriophora TaxID=37862 RepID=A0A1I7XKN3_HETBA